MLDLIKLKEQLESYPPGPWCEDVKTLAVENEIFRGENHALQVELERLRDDNHALQAEVILTLEQHERIREAVARHRVQILDGGHPLAEDVTLWAVLDA